MSAMGKFPRMISEKSALEAIQPHVPTKALEVNQKAFALGVEAGKATITR